MVKYTIKDFQHQFPTDDACLEYTFNQKYGKEYECPGCGHLNCFHRVSNRRCYACAWCGHQIHPTAGTIFHKSSTKLTNWFFAIFLMSQSKNGVSAKELERHLGVTYKTAWRINRKIRELMSQPSSMLAGTVEADETYVGGKRRGKRGRGAENKVPVAGLVQRKGGVKAKAVEDVRAKTLMGYIKENVRFGSHLVTDELRSYNTASQCFRHGVIKHCAREYVRDSLHTNTIEGFWSQVKRSLGGTYHYVSPKYLQTYLDQFVFHYNLRTSPSPVFEVLLRRLCSR